MSVTSSGDFPDPFAELRTTIQRVYADLYKPLNEAAAANLRVANPVAIETAKLRELVAPALASVQTNKELQAQIAGIRETLRQAHVGSLAAQEGWAQSVREARDAHASYLEELDLPPEFLADAPEDPSTELLEEEVTFALDSLDTGRCNSEHEAVAVSPLGWTRKDWQQLLVGGAVSEATNMVEFSSPHAPLIVLLVLLLLTTAPKKSG